MIGDDSGEAREYQNILSNGASTPIEVVCVQNSQRTLQSLDFDPFDLILLVPTLPDNPWIETLAAIQARCPNTPVVVLSDLDDEFAAVKAVCSGAQDFLVKRQTDSRLLIRSLFYAVERKKAEENLKAGYRELLVLQEISEAILRSLDLKSVLETILEKSLSAGSFDLGNVRLLDKSKERIEVVASRRYRDPANIGLHRNIAKDITRVGSLLRERFLGKSYVEENVAETEGLRTLKREGIESAVLVPVWAEGEILGFIQLGSRRRRKFRTHEISLLEAIGNQMGIAIQKVGFYEQTKKQAAELRRANKVKDEFLNFVSHELRMPVHTIMGYGAIMQDGHYGQLSREQTRAIEKITSQSKDLLRVINTLLEAIRLESGSVTVESDELHLNSFLDELKSSFELRLQDEPLLVWDSPLDLPVVVTDALKLKHVLLNLIHNAVKFTEKGTVTISCRYLPEDQRVEFRVADTGSGIPPDSLEQIFEKFHQIRKPGTPVQGGIGLGLHIVKSLTELLGGRVRVESETGKGSTFSVTLPMTIKS